MKTLILICFSLNLCFGQKITNISNVELNVRVWTNGKCVTDQSLKPNETIQLPMSMFIHPWMNDVLVQVKLEDYMNPVTGLGVWKIEDGYINVLLNYKLLKTLCKWKFDELQLSFNAVDLTERA